MLPTSKVTVNGGAVDALVSSLNYRAYLLKSYPTLLSCPKQER
jgi:hypothetical protein